jgi:hypothetical protein
MVFRYRAKLEHSRKDDEMRRGEIIAGASAIGTLLSIAVASAQQVVSCRRSAEEAVAIANRTAGLDPKRFLEVIN